jgi:hypothetical protein
VDLRKFSNLEINLMVGNADLLAHSHKNLNIGRWNYYFSEILKVHRVSNVVQMEIQLNH